MPELYGFPGLMPSGDGRLELFVFATGGDLWHIWQTSQSNGWSDWSAAGAVADSEPVPMARNRDGRLVAFLTTSTVISSIEQTAWSNSWGTGPWLGSPPGMDTPVPPAVTANADGRLILFTVAAQQVWRIEQDDLGGWDPGTWTSHGSPPGQIPWTAPEMICDVAGFLQVFLVTLNGEMWNLRQTAPAGPWSDWVSLGTAGQGFAGRPTVVPSADGRLELFVRDSEGALWHTWQLAVGGQWSEWVSHGNAGVGFTHYASVAPSADGRLELFINGEDGNLWHIWQTAASGGWSEWFSHGHGDTGFGYAPAVAPSADGRLETFTVSEDGNLWHVWQTAASNGWSGWFSHGRP